MGITKKVLTPRQWEKYSPLIEEMQKLRTLSDEEKEQILLQIVSATYIDLLCDWAFKHVFGHNKENLIMLLNDFLPEKVVDIEYDSNELDLFSHDDKLVVMDVVCITESERRILVEMQKSDKANFRSRMLYYGAGMLYRQMNRGDDYGSLMPVYIICFMNFTLRHESDQLVYRYEMRETDTHERYEPSKGKESLLSVFFCELPRFIRPAHHKMSAIEEWFDLLKNMNTFVTKPEHINKRFDGILESCRQSQLPEIEQIQYVRAMLSDREKKDIADAYLQRGLEEGIQQGIRQTAQRLLAAGASVELIQTATGLSAEEIEALK